MYELVTITMMALCYTMISYCIITCVTVAGQGMYFILIYCVVLCCVVLCCVVLCCVVLCCVVLCCVVLCCDVLCCVTLIVYVFSYII